MSVSAHDFEVNGIYYNITSKADETVEVTYKGNSVHDYKQEYYGSITIPQTVRYESTNYKVTSIGRYAFYNCDLTAVNIPESVTSIKDGAFYFCHSLKSVNIPNHVDSISENTFYYCI